MPAPSFKPEVPAYGQKALDDLKLLPGKKHFICEAHLLRTSVVQKDYHHKVPQEAGGSDSAENIAILCSGCHQLIHRLAMMLSSFKSTSKDSPFEVATEYARSINEKNATDAVIKLLEFAQLVAQYRVLKADKMIAPPDAGITTVDIPNNLKVAFKQIAKDIKRGDGRSIGMSNLATVGVLNMIGTHRPELKEEADAFMHDFIFMSSGKTAKPYVDNTEDFDDVAI